MASLVKGPSGVWNVSFRFKGRQFLKSTKHHEKREARTVQAHVDNTLKLLRTGLIPNPEPPQGVNLGDWILSGCNATAIVESITLEAASEAYKAENLNKAENTKIGEAKHLRRLCRVLGAKTKMDRIDLKDIKQYVKRRMSESVKIKGRTYKPVSGPTVQKELLTFTQLWAWARREQYVKGEPPVKDIHNPRKWAVKLPKSAESEPFMTWAEIEAKIKREKTPVEKQGGLWKRLYLDEKQVGELLAHVQEKPRYPFMVAAFLLAADAGLRRSEIINALTTDVSLDNGHIAVREKKRDKSKAGTTRIVPLTKRLKTCLATLLENQTDGAFLIVDENDKPLTADSASHYFKKTLAGSKWKVVRGYHTLRHSFASICLRKTVPVHVTAKWMGHSTQEMIALYQKVYVQDEMEYVKLLD